MKKLLGIGVLGLMWCNTVFADLEIIETKKLKKTLYASDGLVVRTICVDGYRFVLSERAKTKNRDIGGTSNAISMVQFFEERDGKSLPAKC